jgi:hypothetical protein
MAGSTFPALAGAFVPFPQSSLRIVSVPPLKSLALTVGAIRLSPSTVGQWFKRPSATLLLSSLDVWEAISGRQTFKEHLAIQ